VRVQSPEEALLAEAALAMYRELKQVAEASPHGQVLRQIEPLMLQKGWKLMRLTMETLAQEQAAEVEKKTAPADAAPAEDRGRIKGTGTGRC
jgi:hypothetical protein